MNTRQKIAAEIPGVLKIASQHMRKLATQNTTLSQENDSLRHELRLSKIARRMETRGIEPGLSYEDKIASLHAVSVDKLAGLEQAVELAAGGFSLGSLQSDEAPAKTSGELYRSAGGDHLDSFITSQQAFS